jgi:hypothetical protein
MGDNPAPPGEFAAEEGNLKTFFKGFAEAVKDASALQVLTFTGQIQSMIIPEKNKEGTKHTGIGVNWEDFFTQAVNTAGGQLKLIAATQVEVDGDTILFVAENPPVRLVDAHLEAVAAAQEYRQNLVTAVIDLLGFVK